MIVVGLSYIRKHSWWLACSPIFSIWVSSKKNQKSDIGWPRQPPTENMLRFNMIFNDNVKTFFFSKQQNIEILVLKLLNSRSWITLKSSVGIFQALKTSPALLTLVASATSLASTASTAQFPQKTSWFRWSDHPQHQNDQYWSLFVEWIIKNPIFYWYLVPSLSEAVEASLCNFLDFFLMKLKCWILGNMLTTMNVF